MTVASPLKRLWTDFIEQIHKKVVHFSYGVIQWCLLQGHQICLPIDLLWSHAKINYFAQQRNRIVAGLVCVNDARPSGTPPVSRRVRRAQKVEVRFRDASVHQTCLCQRTRDGVTPEEDPTSLKRLNWSQQHGRGPISGQLSAKAAGTVQTRYRGPGTKGNCRSRRGF